MVALSAATVDATAGGFAVREQSSYGQGASYAGVAAGGSLSTMFWNPATMTQSPGIQTEIVGAGIFPYSANSPDPSSTLAFYYGYGGTGNTSKAAFVPSGYASWQVNPNIWLGLSVNSPFGLSVGFPDPWAGRDYAGNTTLRTFNVTPTLAYRVNDWMSVGFGVQFEYANASLSNGIGPEPGFMSHLSGNGWGYGFTAGVTVKPTPTTTVGLGYRSAINQKFNGALTVTGMTPTSGLSTTIDLPDVLSLGVRQRIGRKLTLLGTVEWSNWSRIGTSVFVLPSGAPAMIDGIIPVEIPFQYRDGWLFSVGADYQWTDRLAVRGGLGFEQSPVSDRVRIPLLPDNDRIWVSVGSTYRVSKDLSFDLAYSHLFVKDTSINVSPTSGNPWYDPYIPISYIGDVASHVDIVSVSLKYRWDDSGPAKANNHFSN